MNDNTKPNRLRKIGERTYTTVPANEETQSEENTMDDYTEQQSYSAGDAQTADTPFGFEETGETGIFGTTVLKAAGTGAHGMEPVDGPGCPPGLSAAPGMNQEAFDDFDDNETEVPDEELLEMLSNRDLGEYTDWLENMIEEQMEMANTALNEGMPGYPEDFIKTQWRKARVAYLAHKKIFEESWDEAVEWANHKVATEVQMEETSETDAAQKEQFSKEAQFAKEAAALHEKYFGNAN